jgi:hypothetical protein
VPSIWNWRGHRHVKAGDIATDKAQVAITKPLR